MTPVCAPDATVAVAIRMSVYLDCQARALGENGFQAMAGGPLGTALLSGCVTIFVALIGYRVILGHTPDARDGVGWVLRLGIVFALVTSWPAFQTIVYRVAVDGPGEIAAVVLPSAGLPSESLAVPVQQAYDVLRLGMKDGEAPATAAQGGQGTSAGASAVLPPSPITASVLVMSTAGLAGALRIAIGFLLAIAPIAFVSLLFSGAIGLFNGWVRALAGLALGLAGTTLVTAIDMTMIESEVARLQMLGVTNPLAADRQGMTTIVASFALVAAVTVFVGVKMASALKLPSAHSRIGRYLPAELASSPPAPRPLAVLAAAEQRPPASAARARAAAVAEALSSTVHREQRLTIAQDGQGQPSRHGATADSLSDPAHAATPHGIGVAGRRGIGRHTRSAIRRDQIA
jgi:type IV secretion system protein VirB6